MFVTFDLHVFDERSTWIPVVAQAWHPSTLPCPNNSCDNWPQPPVHGLSDVGLILLETAPKRIKPAKLAHPGTFETDRGNSQEQIVVGYGFPNMPGPPVWSQWSGYATTW